MKTEIFWLKAVDKKYTTKFALRETRNVLKLIGLGLDNVNNAFPRYK